MSRAHFAPVVGAVLLAASVVAVSGGSSAPAAPARVIDRTLLCSVADRAGVREIDVRATSGVREDSRRWKNLASVSLTTGPYPAGFGLVGVLAGAPERSTNQYDYSTVDLSREHCAAAAARVALSARGLAGSAASQIGDRYECVTPRKILVRIRAVFRAPTSLRARTDSLFTRTPLKEASLAARTQSGKRLVFASVAESGKARLFIGESCVPD